MILNNKILVVGAGFSGATVARSLAEAGFKIDIIDQRSHLAGNAYDFYNAHMHRVHKYGPHIFHTNNKVVFDWLTNFTDWIEYKHKVKAILDDGTLVTLPPNIQTQETVGKENIIDTLFRPYTKKMWGLEIEKIDPSILNRVPIRNDNNEHYFPDDKYQFMPKDGYTALVENMLNHENIDIYLNCKFSYELEEKYDHVFNSMAIDEYHKYCFGKLPYRSIKFHHFTLPIKRYQLYPTINFTNDGPITRVTEWKNYPNHALEDCNTTTITFEEPCCYSENNFERYYPVKDIDGNNRKIYERYRALCKSNMTFIGRCGMYVYIDMHQAVSSARAAASRFIAENALQK